MPYLLIVLILLLSGWSNALTAGQVKQAFMLESHGGSTVYVDATLNGNVQAPFLVDTGSGMLTLNQNTFQALQQHSPLAPAGYAAARLANGEIEKVRLYRISSFQIGDSCELGEVEVAVMKSGNNILGMNILSRAAPFTLHTNPPQLTLSGCQADPLARR